MFRDRVTRAEVEQVSGGDVHVFALPLDLVRLRHEPIECVEGELHHPGMRHPCPVVTVGRFALLVGTHFGERFLVSFWIILNRDLRRHSAHGEDVSAMTRLDAE